MNLKKNQFTSNKTNSNLTQHESRRGGWKVVLETLRARFENQVRERKIWKRKKRQWISNRRSTS